jgi:phytoene desaturase
MKHIVVVGAGFAGISASGYLAKAGFRVTLIEKNNTVGGRARVMYKNGFRFDMGPSWYLLTDEHDKWFRDMGKNREQYYDQIKLKDQYRVYYEDKSHIDIVDDYNANKHTFENIEAGAGSSLDQYMAESRFNGEFSLKHFVHKNYDSILSLLSFNTLKAVPRMHLFSSYRDRVKRYFKNSKLVSILEYPTVFLGASAKSLPAVYNLMNWVDLDLGVYYPMLSDKSGGFGVVIESMTKVIKELGVEVITNANLSNVIIENKQVTSVEYPSNGDKIILDCDGVLNTSDYQWFESTFLPEEYRNVKSSSWNSKKLAPSTLNYYVGIKGAIKNLKHHTFFFDSDWDESFKHVYDTKTWSEKPLFYVHVPTLTDPSTAPVGCTALFVLIPCAVNVDDSQEVRDKYWEQVLDRIEDITGDKLRDRVQFVESYGVSDYKKDYNAYQGNAFGLGQTLQQTAMWRPNNYNKKIKNLFYAGHFTLPGTGTSMAMIGGKLAAERITKNI